LTLSRQSVEFELRVYLMYTTESIRLPYNNKIKQNTYYRTSNKLILNTRDKQTIQQYIKYTREYTLHTCFEGQTMLRLSCKITTYIMILTMRSAFKSHVTQHNTQT